MKYEVRNYTMESRGFAYCFVVCGWFDNYDEALKHIDYLKEQDKVFGCNYEYYIKEKEWS